MSDQSLYTLTQMRIAFRYGRYAVAQRAASCAARVGDRLRREQTGQDVLEYAGMIVLVAALVAVLFELHVPHTISQAVSSAVNSIVSNGSSSYSAPAPVTPPANP
jgi:hypothetical protein